MGRPREFDEDAVLTAAADVFWAKGYEATSTRDLTARTGLTPSSIYAAFGDKRTFFRRALDHYLDNTLRERIARMETTLPPGLAITGFLASVVERSLSDPLQRGCMLVNSALETSPQDPEFRDVVAGEIAMIERFFHRCLTAARESGEIPTAESADDGARHLLTVLLGVRVLARIRPERELLEGAVRDALKALGLPPISALPQDGR